jgi:hypothetical protein
VFRKSTSDSKVDAARPSSNKDRAPLKQIIPERAHHQSPFSTRQSKTRSSTPDETSKEGLRKVGRGKWIASPDLRASKSF